MLLLVDDSNAAFLLMLCLLADSAASLLLLLLPFAIFYPVLFRDACKNIWIFNIFAFQPHQLCHIHLTLNAWCIYALFVTIDISLSLLLTLRHHLFAIATLWHPPYVLKNRPSRDFSIRDRSMTPQYLQLDLFKPSIGRFFCRKSSPELPHELHLATFCQF